MKKVWSLVLAIFLLLMLTSCGESQQQSIVGDVVSGTTTVGCSEPTAIGETSTTTTEQTTQQTTKQSTDVVTTKKPSKTETVSTAHKHTFAEATCKSAKKCTICGYTEGKALGHNYKSADCKSEKTCSRCGFKSGEKGDHTYSNFVCTKCGVVDASGIKINTPATPEQFSVIYEFDDSSLYGMVDYVDYTVMNIECVLDDNYSSLTKPYKVGFWVTLRFDGRKREYVGSKYSGKQPYDMTVGEFRLAWVRLLGDTGETYFSPAGCNLSDIERIAQGYDVDMMDGLPFNVGEEFTLAFVFEDLKPGTYTLQFFEGVKAKTYTDITGKDTYEEWTDQ